jgi:hypothetical protein
MTESRKSAVFDAPSRGTQPAQQPGCTHSLEAFVRVHRLAVVLTAFTLISTLPAARAQAQAGQDSGSIAVRTVPPDAQVYIDGERWVGPQPEGRLVVQLPPGKHVIEVRAPGYRSYVSEVDVRPGETTPVNVSLGGAQPPQPGQPPQPVYPPPPVYGPPPVQRPGPPPGPVTGITQVSTEGAESGFAFSPDYRFADVNRQLAHLLGFYAGGVVAGRLFFGGGGYWQLNDTHNNISLAYGGFVTEWRQWNNRPVGLTFHALIGGGDANIGNNNYYIGGPQPSPYHGGYYYSPYYYGHEGFFIFEPEAQVNVRLARDFRFTAGVSYRLTSTYNGIVSGDQLNGVSGTISVRFGK